MIPKTTSPLVKYIRTFEGIAVLVFGVILTLVPIISSNLPPALATSLNTGKWLALVTVVSRTGLKIVALLKGAGLDPIPATPPFQVSGQDVNAVLQEIETGLAAVEAFQNKPGTPADQVTAGLSPEPPISAPVSVEPTPAPIV